MCEAHRLVYHSYPGTSIFLLKRVLRGNGSNDHEKLKSENGFVKQNRKLVSDFLCERQNRLNVPLKIKRIQGFGPRFRGTGFSVWLVLTLALKI